jgi:hypothetical protein
MGDEKLAFVADSTSCRRGYVGILEKLARDLYEYNLKNLKKGKSSNPDNKLPDK